MAKSKAKSTAKPESKPEEVVVHDKYFDSGLDLIHS